MIFCKSNLVGRSGRVRYCRRREKKIGETTERIPAADQDSMMSNQPTGVLSSTALLRIPRGKLMVALARGNAGWFSPRTVALSYRGITGVDSGCDIICVLTVWYRQVTYDL